MASTVDTKKGNRKRDRIRLFGNTIRLSADFLIALADTIRMLADTIKVSADSLIVFFFLYLCNVKYWHFTRQKHLF